MYLKDDKIIATLWNKDSEKSFTMRSYKTGLSKQLVLNPTAIQGWTDGVSVRRSNTPRLVKNGDFREKATMGARLISFSGTALAGSIAEMQQLRDEFVGMLTDGEYGTLSVQTNAGIRYAYVGLEGSTSWVPQGDTIASWKIDLYAPDPHLYGALNNVQTGIVKVNKGGLAYPLSYRLNYNLTAPDTAQTIKNNGNAPAWPIFRVTGDFHLGFTLYDSTGNIVQYTGMVTKAAPVTIDMGAGTATQTNIDKTVLVVKRDWFSIPPGGTLQPEFVPTSDSTQNGSGWCDILYRDTWI